MGKRGHGHFGSRRYLAKDQLERGPKSPLERSAAGNLVGVKSEAPPSTSVHGITYVLNSPKKSIVGSSWGGYEDCAYLKAGLSPLLPTSEKRLLGGGFDCWMYCV